MNLSVHRKEQWDLGCVPWVCVHRRTPNSSSRVFCLWSRGFQVGSLIVSEWGVIVGGRFRVRFKKAAT